MVVSGDQPHRWIIHDRDSIYSEGVDATVAAMGLTILKTPVRAPQANAYCERLIGTIRRECLDWVIPLNEQHVRRVLAEWVAHYNGHRTHAGLEGRTPEPSTDAGSARASVGQYRWRPHCRGLYQTPIAA
jgi:transposase InsO family protein